MNDAHRNNCAGGDVPCTTALQLVVSPVMNGEHDDQRI